MTGRRQVLLRVDPAVHDALIRWANDEFRSVNAHVEMLLRRALADAGGGVWWTGLYPGLAIVLLVTGLTLVGEGLNETLNPTLRRRRLLPVVMPPRDQTSPFQEEQS